MATKMTMSKALKKLRSGRIALAQPTLMFIANNQDSGRDVEQTPEPWQGQGNKRKKPQRS